MCVCVCVYSLFVHSSVDRHLGCFCILAVVNNAIVNTGVHVYFQMDFFPDIYPGMELLGHNAVLFSVFWESPILFSAVTVPVYIPTCSLGVFPLLHIPTNICYLCSLWWSPFWQVWDDVSLWFWFAFPVFVVTVSPKLKALCQGAAWSLKALLQ